MELHSNNTPGAVVNDRHNGPAKASAWSSLSRTISPEISELRLTNYGDHFRAFSLRDATGSLSPFIGVDHVWMSAPTFPPHSHQGTAVLSYLFLDSETGMANRDSLGNRNTIRPGGLHWTTTGSGIVHEEVPAEGGKAVHSLQIFISLSADQRDAEPSALMLEPENVPVLEMSGVTVRVPFGRFGDVTSPLNPPTPVGIFDVQLEAGAELSLPLAPGSMAFVLPISGSILVNGNHFERGDLTLPVFLPSDASSTVTLRAKHDKAWIVVFSGIPDQPQNQEDQQ